MTLDILGPCWQARPVPPGRGGGLRTVRDDKGSAFPHDAWRPQGRTNNLWQVPEEEGNERGTQAGVRKMGDYVLFAQTFGHLVASAFPLDVSCSRAVGTESPSTTNSCFAFSGDGQETPPFI